jgi:Tol biopolymer transport system component
LDVAIQIARALAAAHNAGIVHRDIKPENIMLRPDGYVKVVDFGLAKLTEQHEARMAAALAGDVDISSGLVMGTVKYMSPEQAQAKLVDARSDIFSLGVVLYEMLTGRAPFEGEKSPELINSILKEDPPRLTHVMPDLPIELERIVGKALSKAKSERYDTAEKLVVDLTNLKQLQHASTSQSRTRPSTRDQLSTGTSSVQVVRRIGKNRIGLALTFVILVVVGGLAIFAIRKLGSQKKSLSFQNASVIPLTSVGAGNAAISPDGRFIAHQSQMGLLLSPADGSLPPAELLPNTGGRVFGLVFSADGQSLYFNREENGNSALYRVTINGGPAVKVIERVHSRITFSPDGQKLAFIRSYSSEGESALIVANVDGTHEKRIAMRKEAAHFSGIGLSWSADGKEIVAMVEGGSVNESGLIRVDVENGAESRISTPTEWPRFRDVASQSNGSLVVVVTEGGPTSTSQIWELSAPAWTPGKITDNETFYESISLAQSANVLLAVERKTTADIWISPLADGSQPKQITNTASSGRGGVCWMPDGRINYHARVSGRDEIWTMNAEGGNAKSLTPNSHGNFWPSAPANGSYMAFMSRRTGALHVWRLETESANQVQLTSGTDEQFPEVTADGKWVYYVSWDSGAGTIWKVSINGGPAQQVVNESSLYPQLSPDGKLLAYVGFDNEMPVRKVVSVDDARLQHSFRDGLARLWMSRWSRSGDALLYLDQRDGIWNVWSQPLSGHQPKQLTHFNDGRIYFFDLSPDGKNLVLSRGHESRALVMFRARD